MPRYVDGYVLPVPKKNVEAYRRMAQKAGRIWREHGALEYRECVGDDLNVKGLVSLPRAVKAKPGETVVFAWIVFKSRAHRDRVNANVMKDPRIAKMTRSPCRSTPSAWSTAGSRSSSTSPDAAITAPPLHVASPAIGGHGCRRPVALTTGTQRRRLP